MKLRIVQKNKDTFIIQYKGSGWFSDWTDYGEEEFDGACFFIITERYKTLAEAETVVKKLIERESFIKTVVKEYSC
jgi:hypothetical protein